MGGTAAIVMYVQSVSPNGETCGLSTHALDVNDDDGETPACWKSEFSIQDVRTQRSGVKHQSSAVNKTDTLCFENRRPVLTQALTSAEE